MNEKQYIIGNDNSKNETPEQAIPTTVTLTSEDYGAATIRAKVSPRASLTSEDYGAATIRAEFKSYQSMLPKPHKLLQQQHSPETLRAMLSDSKVEIPRFLKNEYEDGIKPHHALCCMLLDDTARYVPKETAGELFFSWMIKAFSLGLLQRQRNLPAEIIREQFNRVAHAIPSDLVTPEDLRKNIRSSGRPIPNFFLDPENDKQFPPHIALLVILQDGEVESKYLGSWIYSAFWYLFSFVALILRLVLEVIGGAGAIWGGSEVFFLRTDDNKEQCRVASIAVGVFCFLRFIVLNAPQREDEGDILGPAGPWSLRVPARMRAVANHPFHYFVRARRPFKSLDKKHDLSLSK
eukprot:CAMPEP_0194393800 /NCGR_PEP_ID=MMETSP0174-20130528/123496_1 /TAXON_ID=216777 /ORGANISM="Proboscia alata, Strain PI-D3" /LENGTH=349 /DNA_ID=CAMNT_0039189519 /DNA_START=830 /DNA_END=1879 /DNA_ORIENTATION=-